MIYENIKRLCDRLKITIAELEKRAGIGNGTIGGWKTSFPRADKLKAVADVLGVTVDDLMKEPAAVEG